MSKFSLDALNRNVFPTLKCSDPDVILGASFGEDFSLTRIQNGILVSHVDPIVGAVKNIGWLAVHIASNDVATSGARPRWLLLLVLVPGPDDEKLVGEIMRDVNRAAGEIKASVIGGHTGYSNNLKRPLVAVTALGTLSGQDPVLTNGARIGDHIILTKGIALEGTAILAHDFAKTAGRLGINKHELAEARQLMKKISIVPEALIFAREGATSMHDVTRGGLLETLLEMANLSAVGFHVHFNNIPIPAIVSRFSEAFHFDPLRMISSGTLVACIPADKVVSVEKSLKEKDIPYADIGSVTEGEGIKIIRNCGFEQYNDIQSEYDELARMWEEFRYDKK